MTALTSKVHPNRNTVVQGNNGSCVFVSYRWLNQTETHVSQRVVIRYKWQKRITITLGNSSTMRHAANKRGSKPMVFYVYIPGKKANYQRKVGHKELDLEILY